MELDADYIRQDHGIKEHDRYARAKYKATIRLLAPHIKTGSLLYNIGSGSGYFNHLAVRAGCTVIACEPDAEVFRVSQLSLPGSNCEVLPIGLEDFAQNRQPADFVVMHDVLEHIFDDRAAAKLLSKLLKPGGRGVISVPANPLLFGKHDEEMGHFRRYTKRSLTSVLQDHFSILRLQYYGMASIPIVAYFSVWKRSPYPRVAASQNLVTKAYGTVCELESHISEPLGTSILAELSTK